MTDEARERFWQQYGIFWARAALLGSALPETRPEPNRLSKEARFLEDFWLTFAVNHQTVLAPVLGLLACFFLCTFLQHALTRGFELSTTGWDEVEQTHVENS